jgi:hypothetical protein
MNPITCSNCGHENPGDVDFCEECEQPLTQSAESGVIEQMNAQEHGTLGGNFPSPGMESGHVPGTDTTVRDGLPTD